MRTIQMFDKPRHCQMGMRNPGNISWWQC